MYNLPYYKEKDITVVIDFMKQHPFAFLTGVDAQQRPVATQAPLLLEERDGVLYLRGHIMRKNDHHTAFRKNNRVLAVFTSPASYVSASWYENPQQGSTWNYMSVHAHGEMSFLPEDALRKLLEDTTTCFENNDVSPASYRNLPEEYISRMLPAIEGFEIKVDTLDHVFKLSQNRDRESYHHILAKLEAGDAGAQFIAEEMRKRKDILFPS